MLSQELLHKNVSKIVWLGLILPHFDHGFLWHQGRETVETARLCWGKTFQVQEGHGLT